MKSTTSLFTRLLKSQMCLIGLFCFLSLSNSLIAQTNPEGDKLGLVLSGGGSKGIAQVGVLGILEKEGIRPDYITGTSIGSILGGLYAIGYSSEDLKKLALGVDWTYYFDDELERDFYPIEERDAAERYQIQFPIKNGKISFPTGVVRGKKISLLLSRLTIPAHGINNFDDFQIPFRAIATDLETGKAVVYSKGDLADVMRASMSIPSVFVPFEIDGKLLIDGGVARNLPVEDVINMGANKVIAVDIGAPLYKREDIVSILEVLDQTSSFRIVAFNKAQAKLADVVIRPQIANISGLSFDQNDTLMYRGEAATLVSMPKLKKMMPASKRPIPVGVNIPEEVTISDFEILGCEEKMLKTIRDLLQIKKNKIYTLTDIENRIKRLYGSELVAMASYRLLKEEKGYKLIVKIESQRGEFVRLSANYDSRLKAGLLLNLTLRNRIFSGSKFNVDLKISENPSLNLDYYVHTSSRPNIGWHLGGRINFYPGATYIDGQQEERFDIRHVSTEANIFSTFNNLFLASTGIGLERFVRSDAYFEDKEEDLSFDQLFVHFRFLRDSYNREHFPTGGAYLELNAKYTFDRYLELGFTDSTSTIPTENTAIHLQTAKAFSLWEKVTPIVGLSGGYIRRTENNFLNRFYLGRALPNEISHIEFMGLRYMEMPVSAYAMGQFKLQIEPFKDIFTSLVYNAARYSLKELKEEGGQITDEVVSKTGYLHGAGIELGWLTRLGPAVFTTEYNFQQDRLNFSLHIGHLF